MPTYIADVRDGSGKTKKEKINADTLQKAREKLTRQGLRVTTIKQSQSIDLSQIKMEDINAALSSVKVKDRAIFSRQFAAMVNAGVAMVRALAILAEQCSNPKMKKALLEIGVEVQQGTNLSDAMRKHPDCFDKLYYSLVQAGEVGGVLDEVLNRLAKFLEDRARLQNQIKSAMAYPVTVGVLAILVFLGMTMFLIPVFAKIFTDLNAPLPPLTQAMLAISGFLRSWGIVVLVVGIIAGVIAFQQFYKTPAGRLATDRVLLKLPLFGDLNEKSSVAIFCRTFGTLTRSGVPILLSLEIVGDTASNQVIANAINASRREVQQGGMLSLALQKEQVFPPLAIQMMSIGEETGELDSMLMKVADFYEDEVEQAVKALTSILEPLMMVVLGAMVGVILLSMYLPMFSIFDKLG